MREVTRITTSDGATPGDGVTVQPDPQDSAPRTGHQRSHAKKLKGHHTSFLYFLMSLVTVRDIF